MVGLGVRTHFLCEMFVVLGKVNRGIFIRRDLGE